MDATEKLKCDLRAVHGATLIIEASRGVPRDLCMAQIRVGMISATLNIIHTMRNQQRAAVTHGNPHMASLIGLFADIADDMLDAVLKIQGDEVVQYAQTCDC